MSERTCGLFLVLARTLVAVLLLLRVKNASTRLRMLEVRVRTTLLTHGICRWLGSVRRLQQPRKPFKRGTRAGSDWNIVCGLAALAPTSMLGAVEAPDLALWWLR